MKNLRSYPGVLTVLVVAVALLINGVVDYINFELAGPSFLGAAGLFVSALVLVAVYEYRNHRSQRTLKLDTTK